MRTVDHSEQLMAEAEQDGLDLHLDSITVCLEDEGRNSAILGLKVQVVSDQGVKKDLEHLGPLECPTGKEVQLNQLKGKVIGSLKMNFEADHTGVAVKYRRKGDQKMIYKTGERRGDLARIW